MNVDETQVTLFTQVPLIEVMQSFPIPNPPRAQIELIIEPTPRVFEPPPALIIDDESNFPIATQRDILNPMTIQPVPTQSTAMSGQHVSPTDPRISEIRRQVDEQSQVAPHAIVSSGTSTDDSEDNMPLARVSQTRHAKRTREELPAIHHCMRYRHRDREWKPHKTRVII